MSESSPKGKETLPAANSKSDELFRFEPAMSLVDRRWINELWNPNQIAWRGVKTGLQKNATVISTLDKMERIRSLNSGGMLFAKKNAGTLICADYTTREEALNQLMTGSVQRRPEVTSQKYS